MGKIIPGWLSKREEKLLAYFAAKTPGLIVEIGSYQGKSTVAMARVTKNKIYAIDPHYLKSYKKFLANTKKYKNIIPIKKTSEKANINWKLPIALLHIDGNHEYEFVKQDIMVSWFSTTPLLLTRKFGKRFTKKFF
jgi:pyrrolidone-carboxylate peptidase